jgi:hypothetical protein
MNSPSTCLQIPPSGSCSHSVTFSSPSASTQVIQLAYIYIYKLDLHIISSRATSRPQFLYFSHLSHTRYVTCASHFPWCDHSNNNVINLCCRLRTLFLFIVLFSTLHVSTSAGHHQVFHIYHTTTVLRARFTSSCFKTPLVCIHIRLPVLFHPWHHSTYLDQLIIKW